jgi:DMSO reductase anchor subunit
MRRPAGERRFHEGPLVVFTGFTVAGGGMGWAYLLRGLLGGGAPEAGEGASWLLPPEAALVMAGLLALGMAASLLHLGRPARGLLALRRTGRSPLSNEVVLAGLAGLLALVRGLTAGGGPAAVGSSILIGVISFLLLVTLGRVYRLAGQEGWGGPALLQPLVLGTIWGGLLLGPLAGDAGSLDGATGGLAPVVLVALLLVDGGLLGLRIRGLEAGCRAGEPVHPRIFRARGLCLAVRLVLTPLLPLAALLVDPGDVILPLISLSLGILLDRWLFYGLALRRTTEVEVDRVDALLLRGMDATRRRTGL